MDAGKTILFSDMDGTLLNSESQVSPRDLAAIEDYVGRGGRFAISTGRQPQNALLYLPNIPLNAPSVVLNGAAVYDYGTGHYSHTRFLRRELSDPVLRRCLREIPGLDLQVYTRDGIFYVTPEATAEPRLLSLHHPCRFVRWEDVDGEPWIKCLIGAPPEHLDALKELLDAGAGEGYTNVPGAAWCGGELLHYFEMMPPGASKGAALRSLRADPALEDRMFFAAGDYWNDYELLSEAEYPLAPANAIPEIREKARRVGPSNDQGFIAWILNELIPSL